MQLAGGWAQMYFHKLVATDEKTFTLRLYKVVIIYCPSNPRNSWILTRVYATYTAIKAWFGFMDVFKTCSTLGGPLSQHVLLCYMSLLKRLLDTLKTTLNKDEFLPHGIIKTWGWVHIFLSVTEQDYLTILWGLKPLTLIKQHRLSRDSRLAIQHLQCITLWTGNIIGMVVISHHLAETLFETAHHF